MADIKRWGSVATYHVHNCWHHLREIRDELNACLDHQNPARANHAVVDAHKRRVVRNRDQLAHHQLDKVLFRPHRVRVRSVLLLISVFAVARVCSIRAATTPTPTPASRRTSITSAIAAIAAVCGGHSTSGGRPCASTAGWSPSCRRCCCAVCALLLAAAKPEELLFVRVEGAQRSCEQPS
jgi:hypothetical protein